MSFRPNLIFISICCSLLFNFSACSQNGEGQNQSSGNSSPNTETNTDNQNHNNSDSCSDNISIDHIYPDQDRPLATNLIKRYYSNQPVPSKQLTLVDFSSPTFTADSTTDFHQLGDKSLRWDYNAQESYSFNIPHDLTEYDEFSFSIYAPEESVGATFQLYFLSENSETDKMDYYGTMVKITTAGWNEYSYDLTKLSTTRQPLGWDQIDKLVVTSTGWNQNNKPDTIIYLDNFILRSIPQSQENQGESEKTLLVDFASSAYSSNASTQFVQEGSKSYKWSYNQRSVTLTVPSDLSAYKAISFWVYVPAGYETPTFYMYFKSETPDTEEYQGMDYYGKMVSLPKEGWNQFVIALDNFATCRNPKGWDQIDSLILTKEGWSQSNDNDTVIYLDNFYIYTDLEMLLPEVPQLTGALFSLNGTRAIIENELISAGFDNDNSAVVFKKDGEFWLPLNVLGTRYDPYATYNPRSGRLQMTLADKNYLFTKGNNNVTIDGQSVGLSFIPETRGQSLFAPLSYFKDLMGYEYEFSEEMGLIYLSNDNQKFTNFYDILDLIYITRFQKPTGAEVISTINSRFGAYGHPRVMLTSHDFAYLKSLLGQDELFTSYFNSLVKRYGPGSDQFNDQPVDYKLTDGVRLLSRSQEAKNRMIPWAFIYRLTGEAQYAMRLWDEVEALINFPTWHPVHFLDTAEIMFAMAIAYDWLYDVWTPNQRSQMESAMMDMGFYHALDRYEGRAPIWGNNNWAGVCNGGIMAAAIAFANAPATARAAQRIIPYALDNMENSLYTYAPDGGYLESPGYWYYGTSYLHVLFSTLESATGSDLGFFRSPGFAESAYFISHMESPAGTWGFHDSSSNLVDNNLLYWFARKSQDPNLGHIRHQVLEAGIKDPNIYDLIWYNPNYIGVTSENKADLDAYYSKVGIVTMKSGDENSLFTGLHGGKNNVNHGDLDIGNFIIYGGNQRYIMDLGSDNYNLPNYFGSSRNYYYRKRAEGQNTLVIGESSYLVPDQIKNGQAEITRYEGNNTSGAIAVVDMTPAYENASGKRGLLFTDNRQTIIIQDELNLTKADIVHWFVHTEAELTIGNNGRTATFKFADEDKILYAEIISSDSSLNFAISPANSLAADYPDSFDDTQKEYKRNSINKLIITTPNKVTTFNLAVAFKLLDQGQQLPTTGTIYSWQNIDHWTIK